MLTDWITLHLPISATIKNTYDIDVRFELALNDAGTWRLLALDLGDGDALDAGENDGLAGVICAAAQAHFESNHDDILTELGAVDRPKTAEVLREHYRQFTSVR